MAQLNQAFYRNVEVAVIRYNFIQTRGHLTQKNFKGRGSGDLCWYQHHPDPGTPQFIYLFFLALLQSY